MLDDDDYVKPDSAEARRFADGARFLRCRLCSVLLLLPMYSQDTDCGAHEPWRVWFSVN